MKFICNRNGFSLIFLPHTSNSHTFTAIAHDETNKQTNNQANKQKAAAAEEKEKEENEQRIHTGFCNECSDHRSRVLSPSAVSKNATHLILHIDCIFWWWWWWWVTLSHSLSNYMVYISKSLGISFAWISLFVLLSNNAVFHLLYPLSVHCTAMHSTFSNLQNNFRNSVC